MTFPQTLIEQLRTKAVIPFVGAGVSRAVLSKGTSTPLFPSWPEVLFEAAKRLEAEQHEGHAQIVRGNLTIKPAGYLEAAQAAKQGLGPVWFKFLREQFDHTMDKAEPQSLALARTIWTLGSNLVLTTNYDRVMHWTAQLPDVAVWDIEARAEQAGYLQGFTSRPTIWHLHGTVENCANIILARDGYARLYGSETTEPLYKGALCTLKTLMATHSFLFIGFSLDDVDFGATLEAVSDMYSDSIGPHYAVLPAHSVDHFTQLQIPSVQPIPFAAFGQPLIDLLISLRDESIGSSGHTSISTSVTIDPTINHSLENVQFDSSCDTPPRTDFWVGRDSQLSLFNMPTASVVAVTGIGGQGKSTLVAKHINDNATRYSVWDWRDCKEETNTLHTHLVRIIERVTRGSLPASAFGTQPLEEVLSTFMQVTANVDGLFVFDNIDKYIDAETSQAVGGMHLLIQHALKGNGRSRFVFTSRPKVQYDSAYYLQIELPGLTMDQTGELFVRRDVDISWRDLSQVYELTNGHPLWINLIATQAFKNKVNIHELVTRIKKGKDTDLPNAMLREIWKTLTAKQQTLLRYLAEAVRPETEDRLADYAKHDINRNQIGKALRQIKALDLVVVKSPVAAEDAYELHPLIREFVRRQFTLDNRKRYISYIVGFVMGIIQSVRHKLHMENNYAMLDHWIVNVELLTNQRDAVAAVMLLRESAPALLAAGYYETFIRLAFGVLGICDVSNANVIEKGEFEDINDLLSRTLSELGRFEEAEQVIREFEVTATATARQVLVCNMKAYYHWSRKDYVGARQWGLKGVALRTESGVDTRHDCSHNLALARRDYGEVQEAMEIFLEGLALPDVVNPTILLPPGHGLPGPYYGNIGRCLYLQGQLDEALVCFIKAAWELERATDHQSRFNRGWAAFWLGDVLRSRKEYGIAFVCFRRARQLWTSVSPFRAVEAQAAMSALAAEAGRGVVECSESDNEGRFASWLASVRRFSAA